MGWGLRAGGRVVRCVASLLSAGAAAATPVPIAALFDVGGDGCGAGAG